MHTTNLRKVGGSVMLAVPPALLDILHCSRVRMSASRLRVAVSSWNRSGGAGIPWTSCSPNRSQGAAR